jgi:hypothetical protein
MQAQLIVSVFLNQTSQRDKAVEREREITYRRRRGVGAAAVERVVSNQREITRVRERKEITHSYFFFQTKKKQKLGRARATVQAGRKFSLPTPHHICLSPRKSNFAHAKSTSERRIRRGLKEILVRNVVFETIFRWIESEIILYSNRNVLASVSFYFEV